MARFIAAVLLGALLLPAGASGADSRAVEMRGLNYSAHFSHPALSAEEDDMSRENIVWDAGLNMRMEDETPVVSTRFRYTVADWLYALPASGPGDVQIWSSSSEAGALLPDEAPRIRPQDVKLMFRFYAPAQNSYVGVPQTVKRTGRPGEWVESQPERPGWDRVFIWQSGINKGDWLPPETARSVWQGTLQPDGVEILKADWPTAGLSEFLAVNNMRGRAVAAAEAVNRLLDGVARSFGYEVDGLREDPEKYAQPAFRRGVPVALLRKLERLQDLPDDLKQGDATAYEQARGEAEAIMAVMEQEREGLLEQAEGTADTGLADQAAVKEEEQ